MSIDGYDAFIACISTIINSTMGCLSDHWNEKSFAYIQYKNAVACIPLTRKYYEVCWFSGITLKMFMESACFTLKQKCLSFCCPGIIKVKESVFALICQPKEKGSLSWFFCLLFLKTLKKKNVLLPIQNNSTFSFHYLLYKSIHMFMFYVTSQYLEHSVITDI